MWDMQWKEERKLVDQRRVLMTRAWKVAEPLKLCWQSKLRTNKSAKKLLKTLIKGVEKTHNLSRNDYRVLLSRIRRFKSFISPLVDVESDFFGILENILQNERQLYGMSVNKERHVKVFASATRKWLKNCEL